MRRPGVRAVDPQGVLLRISDHLILGDECWTWDGSKTDGYGRVRNDVAKGGKLVLVHRVIYEAFTGPIPDGYEIDHTCHDPATCLTVSAPRVLSTRSSESRDEAGKHPAQSGVRPSEPLP